MWSDIFVFRPDIVIGPFMPNNNAMLEALDMEIGKVGNPVEMLEMDHCLSQRKYHRPNLLAMISPFDTTSIILLLVALFFNSLYAYRYSLKSKRFTWHSFIWHLTTELINCSEVSTKLNRWRVIGLSWLIGVFFFHNLFSGDMFTAMAEPPELDVVHTWLDLATKSDKPILVFDAEGQDTNLYLSADVPKRDQLTKRIKQKAYELMYHYDVIEEIMKNVTSGEAYHLGMRTALEQFSQQFFNGKYSEDVYISEEYGQYLPLFVPTNFHTEPIIFNAFNLM